jgi:hypothetical protein
MFSARLRFRPRAAKLPGGGPSNWGEGGACRIPSVPLAALLIFTHGASGLDRNVLHHEPRIAGLQEKIWSTQFPEKPDSFGGAFPADYFELLRNLAREVAVDAQLAK